MGGSTPVDVLQLSTDPDDVDRLLGDLEDHANARLVRDDFAGPGGWSTGIADLLHDAGLTEVALEWDASACATRLVNGHHRTIRADVAAYPVGPFLGRTVGYIGSPPCQTFSMAGGGTGRAHVDLLCECVRGILLGTLTYDDAMVRLADAGALNREPTKEETAQGEAHVKHLRSTGALVDPRNGLILIPARTIRALLDHDGTGPHDLEWVALEQVPPAAPVFRAYAQALRELGFHVVCQVLNSADYGVPQTRERVYVLASRVRRVTVPEPTHAKGGEPESLFGPGRLEWVSMARALGWVGTVNHKRGAGMAERHGEREPRTTDEPAPTITGGSPRRLALDVVRDVQLVNNAQANATRRLADEPAPTLTGGHDHGERRFVPLTEEAGRFLIDRRTNSKAPGWRRGEPMIPTVKVDAGVAPAPTLTSKSGGQWVTEVDGVRDDGLRITETEGGILQGFAPGYVWAGPTKGKRWEQIGNVVVPPVARRVVAELLGVEAQPLPWHVYAWTA